jgi:hypothetical protein
VPYALSPRTATAAAPTNANTNTIITIIHLLLRAPAMQACLTLSA